MQRSHKSAKTFGSLHTLFSGRQRELPSSWFSGSATGPLALPHGAICRLGGGSSWGCPTGTGGSFPGATTSPLVTSDFLLRAWLQSGRSPFQNDSTGSAQTSQSRLAAGETLHSHSMWKGLHWRNSPALPALPPSSLFLWESRDLIDSLVWRRNGASPTWLLSVFLFGLPACRKHTLSTRSCCGFVQPAGTQHCLRAGRQVHPIVACASGSQLLPVTWALVSNSRRAVKVMFQIPAA